MKPSPISIYAVGAALLGVFAAAVWALSGDGPGGGGGIMINRLTTAAKHCGFAEPRFVLKDGTYVINETFVSGRPNPRVPPEGQRLVERSKLLQAKLMPCLEAAATANGVRVSYEKMVMVN